MNKYLKYLVIISLSMVIGFAVGRVTQQSSTISNDNMMLSDSANVNSVLKEKEDVLVDSFSVNSKNELFYNFVNTFFRDSSFQLSRIKFPLKANTPINHYNNDTTSLNVSEWKFIQHDYKLIVYDCDGDERMIEETSDGANRLFYEFKRMEYKWYLVRVYEMDEFGNGKFRN